jgi:asparagine synthetase B (glutamine-hydrolysing)
VGFGGSDRHDHSPARSPPFFVVSHKPYVISFAKILTMSPTTDITTEIDELLSEAKIEPRDGAGKTGVVPMSGGVDSAVTALIMRERGYRVVGMKLRPELT